MKLRFQENSSQQWLRRIQLTFVLSMILAGGLVYAASIKSSARTLFDSLMGNPLSASLNVLIVLAGLGGAVVLLAWLRRAAREERLINRFFSARGEALLQRGPAAIRELALDAIPASALLERLEIISAGIRNASRIDPSTLADALAEREQGRVAIARYIAGTLILLGLLGTFVGLVVTVGGVTKVVSALDLSHQTDMSQFLVQLKEGIRQPLDGMGLAFSTSLVGLAGSMILGIGALGLASAQAAWTGKLEEITALCTPTSTNAMGASGPGLQWREDATGDEVLAELVAAGHFLHGLQHSAHEQLMRTAKTAEHSARALEQLTTRIENLTAPLQRVEQRNAELCKLVSESNEHARASTELLQLLAEQAKLQRDQLRESGLLQSSELTDALRNLQGGVIESLAELRRSVQASANSSSPTAMRNRHQTTKIGGSSTTQPSGSTP